MGRKNVRNQKKRKPFQADTPEDLLRQDFTGDCYRAAVEWASASKAQSWTVVHGTVRNLEVGRLKHAWCERDEAVIDLAMPVGMRQFKRDKYYRVLDPDVTERYSAEHAVFPFLLRGHHRPPCSCSQRRFCHTRGRMDKSSWLGRRHGLSPGNCTGDRGSRIAKSVFLGGLLDARSRLCARASLIVRPAAIPWPAPSEEITGALANVVLCHLLDFFRVFALVNGRIERFRLTCRLQVLSQLPSLEVRVDLSHEGGNLGPEAGISFGGFEEVQKLVPDQVIEGFVRVEVVFNTSCGFALFDPDFFESRRRTLALSEKLFVAIGILRWIVVGKVGAEVSRHSNEASVITASLDDMELPASELRVAFLPLLQDGVNVRLDQRAVRGEFAVEERDDYDSAFCHGVFLHISRLAQVFFAVVQDSFGLLFVQQVEGKMSTDVTQGKGKHGLGFQVMLVRIRHVVRQSRLDHPLRLFSP